MNMQQVAAKKLTSLGYIHDITLQDGGNVEVMAFAGTVEETYAGKLSGLARWLNLLPDMSPIPMSEEAWEEEYGAITQADVDNELACDRAANMEAEVALAASQAPTQESANAEEVTETPIEVADTSSTNNEKEKEMNLVQKAAEALKNNAAVTAAATPATITPVPSPVVATQATLTPPAISNVQVLPAVDSATLAEALTAGLNCAILSIDYQDARMKMSFNRRIRVASVTPTKVFAYDLVEYNKEYQKLVAEAPPGQALEVSAARAAILSSRTFIRERIKGVANTGELAGPLNPNMEGVILVRPTTDKAAADFGGLPRAVNAASAEAYVSAGFEFVSVGQ